MLKASSHSFKASPKLVSVCKSELKIYSLKQFTDIILNYEFKLNLKLKLFFTLFQNKS